MPFDQTRFDKIRDDFPILASLVRNKPLVFLDTAASSQKPKCVIDSINHFYSENYANVHRGIYELSARASEHFEKTRQAVKEFINAKKAEEIIFVKGATEGINFIANTLSLGAGNYPAWQPGDEVILSEMEHHANIVPWYFLKKRLGIELRIIPVNDIGELDLNVYAKLFSKRTRLVAITHVSNVLGTINPIKQMISLAHQQEVPVLIDGAQAAPHLPVDMQDLDCDFYTFSAHKLYGPTGIGVLYIKDQWESTLSPYQGGGNMINTVSFNEVTFAKPPHCFEAGTPPIASVIGFFETINYLAKIGMDAIYAHNLQLLTYANEQFAKHSDITIYGRSQHKIGIISFTMDGIHPHDIGTILDHEGIAVRVGHHCAMPLMERYNVPAMVRIGFGIYNTQADIDVLCQTFDLVRRTFN